MESKFPQKITIAWLKFMYSKNLITPKEVISEIIRRSEKDEEYNIWITKPNLEFIQEYLNNLESMDKSLPLWGIPFAIKDNIDLKNVVTTAGCPKYGYVPKENAVVVERLIKQGAIPVGKTNLDQFATGLVGTRSPYGEVHNSLEKNLISGGSSSGSAVAVARGESAFALGTDTAGSGRVPAALNNLIGLKPSVGAWPIKGLVPACESLDCITVFTNKLEDAKLVDDIVRGYSDDDKWSKNIKKDYLKLPKTICIPKNNICFYGDYKEYYKKQWENFLTALKSLDIKVEYIEIEIFEKAAKLLYGGPWISERWSAVGKFVERNEDDIFNVTKQILIDGSGEKFTATEMFDAIHELQIYKKEAYKLLKDKALILPTCGGTFTIEQVKQNPIETNSMMGLYTNHCNLLDLCAVAIPVEFENEKLPFGISIFGLNEAEGLVYNVANKILHTQSDKIDVAVCGLHMRGLQFENQMNECFAEFIKETKTAPKYRLVKIDGAIEKPGLIKVLDKGKSIELEIWRMNSKMFGKFIKNVTHPLSIGEIELIDNTKVYGFLCEGYMKDICEDISSFGGWKNYIFS